MGLRHSENLLIVAAIAQQIVLKVIGSITPAHGVVASGALERLLLREVGSYALGENLVS